MKLYLLLSSFLNCAGTAVLGVSMLMAGWRNPRNLLFGLFLFNLALWSAFYFLWRGTATAEWALLFSQLLMIAAGFIPVTLLHFLSRLTGEKGTLFLVLGYGLSAAFGVSSFFGAIVESVAWTDTYGFWPRAGGVFPYMLGFFVVYTLLSLWLLWKHSRDGSTPAARQLRYIMLALVIGFVGGATNFPLWFDIPIPPVGNGVVLVYTAMMAHAIVKYRLPEISIDLAKGMVYSCLALTLSVFYVVVYATGSYLFGAPFGSLDLARQFFTGMVVIGVFLWLSPRLKVEADRLMEQTLFKGRYLHRGQLKDLATRIFTITDEARLFSESAAAIARALHVDHAAIYFRAELQAGYTLRAAVGYARHESIPEIVPDQHALPLLLQHERTAVVYQEAELAPVSRPPDAIRQLRDTFRFEALVPIHGHDNLLGFLLLGHPKRDGFFDDLDLSMVETLCLQIGLAVRSRQLERRTNQTEKLISLGTLAAGLAHELRNPLVSIKTFTDLLKEHGTDPEFQQGFLQVMSRDVKRIESIVDHVAAFAENQQVALAVVDLREVCRSVADITAEERRKVGVELQWPRETQGSVEGNFGQLVQIFFNLVQNALHALEQRPNPRIEIAWREERSGDGRWLRVEVTDNGKGIETRILPRIFDPFVTTKATGSSGGSRRGMGLGLAIVKRIVDGHHAQIGVDSVSGCWTRFTLLFPLTERTA